MGNNVGFRDKRLLDLEKAVVSLGNAAEALRTGEDKPEALRDFLEEAKTVKENLERALGLTEDQ